LLQEKGHRYLREGAFERKLQASTRIGSSRLIHWVGNSVPIVMTTENNTTAAKKAVAALCVSMIGLLVFQLSHTVILGWITAAVTRIFAISRAASIARE
jgi:hypothetical protein